MLVEQNIFNLLSDEEGFQLSGGGELLPPKLTPSFLSSLLNNTKPDSKSIRFIIQSILCAFVCTFRHKDEYIVVSM